MEIEQALKLASDLLVNQALRPLTDVETLILRGAWEQQTYEAIAEQTGYSNSYLRKDVGPRLWRDLSIVLGEPVSKANFKSALDRKWGQRCASATPVMLPRIRDDFPRCNTDWGEAIDVSVFFGRSPEQLPTRLRGLRTTVSSAG